MILTQNLPLDFATQRGFHNFAHLLLGDKLSTLPTTDVVVKHIEMFHESLFLTAKMFMARSKAVCCLVDDLSIACLNHDHV